ncbi:hypothetical protein [Clostridium sp. ZS2-4]|nr:hypothetical protein [Clostridium sp. ZS2-4]MCY6354184.1 hypothetical protein [Clostridium sp. ZS2-4]
MKKNEHLLKVTEVKNILKEQSREELIKWIDLEDIDVDEVRGEHYGKKF